ncbi:MAG: ABC transporter ATP-binding protein [Roseiflexaceae bacterium]|nr:ABC transporter ATP-binding protein [Roseiflexaceae bacterium]
MLKVRNIHTYYGGSHVLHDVSLDLEAGQTVALLGRNGAGKTTTINSIIGFVPPRAGSITFKGATITGAPPYTLAHMGMGLVPQGRRIFSSLTVEENLRLAQRAAGRRNGWSLERIYATFPVLQERAKSGGTQLSGGEQQMLAIARALATGPDVLLLDEPSEGLAPLIVAEVGRMLAALKREGLAMLLVEQHVALAISVADVVYVLNKGQIVFSGAPAILQQNSAMRQQYLGV